MRRLGNHAQYIYWRNKAMPKAIPSPIRTDVDVLKAASSMTELLRNQELCWMDPELAADCGIVVGDQIRLKRNTNNYALYTVSAFSQEGPANDDIRMGLVGRQKLGTSEPMTNIALYTGGGILRSDLTDGQAKSQSEFVERLVDYGPMHKGLVACAPHGGAIELLTDKQAEYVSTVLAAKKVSSWCCKGWKQDGGAFDRWHITASDISPNSFPLLKTIEKRGFTHAVSFHGWSAGGILIGGLGPMKIKQDLQNAIITAINDASISVTIADADDAFNGDDPANLVNWLTAGGTGGIQLEQSLTARSDYWQQIAGAVASVFDKLLL
jgi:phage replication-related protein YjqB (UPF0714/DUF867 family)